MTDMIYLFAGLFGGILIGAILTSVGWKRNIKTGYVMLDGELWITVKHDPDDIIDGDMMDVTTTKH